MSVSDRDLLLNPTHYDQQLPAAYERGEIGAFEYHNGHTYRPNREIGPTDNSDGPDQIY